jgi:hypothetical protein
VGLDDPPPSSRPLLEAEPDPFVGLGTVNGGKPSVVGSPIDHATGSSSASVSDSGKFSKAVRSVCIAVAQSLMALL